MTFAPKISRYANMYFFIQNLAEWHFSNRKAHNAEWRGQLKLSIEAKSCLKEFQQIHLQYPYGKKYLGRPFFLDDDPWPKIEHLVGKNVSKKIANIFTVLEPFFYIIYIEDEKALKRWQSIISKSNFSSNTSYINTTLAQFYGCKPYSDSCTVHLLLSTKERNGGTSGTLDDHSITLELSHVSIKSERLIKNIIWHELIHLYFRNDVFYPLLKKVTHNDMKDMKKIDELVASSLLPNGLLKLGTLAKISDTEITSKFNAHISSEKIQMVQKLIHPYLHQEKSIDQKLVLELYKLCK